MANALKVEKQRTEVCFQRTLLQGRLFDPLGFALRTCSSVRGWTITPRPYHWGSSTILIARICIHFEIMTLWGMRIHGLNSSLHRHRHFHEHLRYVHAIRKFFEFVHRMRWGSMKGCDQLAQRPVHAFWPHNWHSRRLQSWNHWLVFIKSQIEIRQK